MLGSPSATLGTDQGSRYFPYVLLYSFGGSLHGGANPQAELVNVKGTLYGTTQYGGEKDSGTVFAISTSGKEQLLYSFAGGTKDGSYPLAELLNVNGTLYGTTENGGTLGQGTVFAVTRSGKETVLHNFGGSGDGAYPLAGLINVNGTLYGTTSGGGAYNYAGTVFAITPSGTERVLHSFKGFPHDGASPAARLLNVKDTLYGTTGSAGRYDGGTVFAITTSGNETVLYSFGYYSKDGEAPSAGLIKVGTKLYGTTYTGSIGNHGTIFAMTVSGKETVLHIFGGASYDDGANPQAALIDVKGTLYGTTSNGGGGNYCNCGTVFAITP